MSQVEKILLRIYVNWGNENVFSIVKGFYYEKTELASLPLLSSWHVHREKVMLR